MSTGRQGPSLSLLQGGVARDRSTAQNPADRNSVSELEVRKTHDPVATKQDLLDALNREKRQPSNSERQLDRRGTRSYDLVEELNPLSRDATNAIKLAQASSPAQHGQQLDLRANQPSDAQLLAAPCLVGKLILEGKATGVDVNGNKIEYQLQGRLKSDTDRSMYARAGALAALMRLTALEYEYFSEQRKQQDPKFDQKNRPEERVKMEILNRDGIRIAAGEPVKSRSNDAFVYKVYTMYAYDVEMAVGAGLVALNSAVKQRNPSSANSPCIDLANGSKVNEVVHYANAILGEASKRRPPREYTKPAEEIREGQFVFEGSTSFNDNKFNTSLIRSNISNLAAANSQDIQIKSQFLEGFFVPHVEGLTVQKMREDAAAMVQWNGSTRTLPKASLYPYVNLPGGLEALHNTAMQMAHTMGPADSNRYANNGARWLAAMSTKFMDERPAPHTTRKPTNAEGSGRPYEYGQYINTLDELSAGNRWRTLVNGPAGANPFNSGKTTYGPNMQSKQLPR